MGGYRTANANPLGEGILCGSLATYFTFLPSFAFILIGAPWIERLRKWQWLTGAMAGISAAVVGVILHLGVTVWLRVWWPNALTVRPVWGEPEAWGPLDLYAVGMSIIAGVALLRLRFSVPLVVLAAGLIGIVRWFLEREVF
jgi:chromate transporter